MSLPAGTRKPLPGASDGGARTTIRPLSRPTPCARCRQTFPPHEFPLWEHAEAAAMKWATRRWCLDCLVERGHITKATAVRMRREHAEQVRAEVVRAAAERAEAAETERVQAELARRDALVAALLDRAAADEGFAAALERAARYRAEQPNRLDRKR